MTVTDQSRSEDLRSAQPDDRVLLGRYAETGDAEAFQILVTRYQNLVWSACRRILGDSSDAEDAVQNVFLALAKSAASIESNLAAWLHATAVNCSTSLVRSAVTRRKREQQHVENLDTAGDEHTWNEMRDLIDVCLAELNEDDRELIIQRFYCGMTQLEIGERLGIGQQAVAVRLKKTVDQLRHALKRRGLPVTAAALAGTLKAGLAEASAPTHLTETLTKIGISGVGHTKSSAGIGLATIATGFLAIIPVVLCLFAAWSVWKPRHPPLSSILAQLDAARSVQYMSTGTYSVAKPVGLIEPQDVLESYPSARYLVLDGYLERVESLDQNGDIIRVMIANYRTGKVVLLNLQAKTYSTNVRFWWGQNAGLGDPNQVEQRKLAPQTALANHLALFSSDTAETLTSRDSDGRQLIGYRIEALLPSPADWMHTERSTLWVDSESMRPVRIITSFRSDHPEWVSSDSVTDNFVFDAELPRSLFSTDPPAGFRLNNVIGPDGPVGDGFPLP